MPTLLILHMGMQQMIISHRIVVQLNTGTYIYKLKGMIYFGGYHFTSQFVDNSGGVWYHDGAAASHDKCEYQGLLQNMNNKDIIHVHNRQLLTAIYVLA